MEVVTSSDIVQDELFCHLVEQYQLALLHTCCIYLRDRALAEDAVQETFLKAYQAIGNFRGECSEKTWLMRIAMNTCHDMKRSGWFRYMDRHITPDLLPEPQTVSVEAGVEIVTEITKLPPKLREVILLYYYQNMNVYEIAEALGIDHSSVSNRMKRAKDQLRIAMKGAYFNE
ncbi:MAG: sigma-70 family RNA polymerase sigma factor [Clostridia bacterium]